MTSPSASNFVGRQKEMAELRAALDGALSGTGQIVLLAGEPGIGKTRLAVELASVAKERSATVLWGTCYEQPGAPPYWPWVQVVRDAIRAFDQLVVKSAAAAAGAHVTHVFPDLDSHVDSEGVIEPDDPAVARFKSLDAAATFFLTLSDNNPIVLILDDLHWADQATLDLLEFFSGRIKACNILVIGAFRDTELDDGHEITSTLRSVSRGLDTHRVSVMGLNNSDARELIANTASHTLTEKITEEIEAQTEGNPFFISEIVRDLVDSDKHAAGEKSSVDRQPHIPGTVLAVVGRRLQHLSKNARRILSIGAVMGREFELAEIEIIDPDLTVDVLEAVVLEAVSAGELVEVIQVSARYRFAHPLIPQALLGQLDLQARARLHAEVARGLELFYDDPYGTHPSELAEHYVAAGSIVSTSTTGRYTFAAGLVALAAYSWADAQRWYELSLSLFSPDQANPEILAEIHRGLGRSMASLDRQFAQTAWNHCVTAFELFLESGRTERALEALTASVAFRFVRGTTTVLEQAIELAIDGSRLQGFLLIRLAYAERRDREDLSRSRKTLIRAQEIAEVTSDAELQASIEQQLSSVEYGSMNYEQAVAHGEQAKKLDPSVVCRLVYGLAASYIALGRPQSALHLAEKGLEEAIRLRDLHFIDESLEKQYEVGILNGDWSLLSEVKLSIAEFGLDAREWRAWPETVIECATGEGPAIETLDQRPADENSYPILDWLSLSQGLAPDLSKHLTQVHERIFIEPIEFDQNLRDLAMFYVINSDKTKVEDLFDDVLSSPTPVDYVVGSTDRQLGRMALILGRHADAQKHFEAAIDFCRSSGYLPELARTCYLYAQMLIERKSADDRELVVQLLDEGVRVASSVDMNPLLRLFDSLSEGSDGGRSFSGRNESGLTRRQEDVTRIVAKGKSNQEIATDLDISVHTVARHIANIYQNVDVSNRVELAAFANRIGLIQEPSDGRSRQTIPG